MKKSLLSIVLLATVNSILFAENDSSFNRTMPLEFRKTTPSKNRPTDSDTQLIGEIGDGVLTLDFSDFEGTAQVKCKDLVTGDQCTYSTSANGTSYQYIGEVTGVLQITVTTAESSYECITIVE